MAELINQILALPRSEKWHIFAILAEELRSEEIVIPQEIPLWQIDLAQKAKSDIESGKVTPWSNEQFWAAIDAKVEQLENLSSSPKQQQL